MLDFTNTDSVYYRRAETVRLYCRNGSKRQVGRSAIRLQTVSPKRKRGYIADPETKQLIESSDDIYKLLMPLYARLDPKQSHLVLMVLNVRREVDGFKLISSGPQSGVPSDPKIILRNALMLGAVKIILAHNHPSGSLKPSTADIGFTEKVIEAGKAIDIPLVDHIIFTPKGYTSMRADRHCVFEAFA